MLYVEGRDCPAEVMELPDESPALLGQLPLEAMDFWIDTTNQRLVGNPDGGSYAIYATMDLEAGLHPVCIQTFAAKLPAEVRLTWQPPGAHGFTPVPDSVFRTQRLPARPTTSGKKQLALAATRPGDGEALTGVHPAYDVMTVRPAGMEMPVGGLDLLSDGRLVVATFDARRFKARDPQPTPDGELWILENADGDDRARITATRIAKDLYEPAGIRVVDDVLYVSQRNEVSRFTFNAETGAYDHAVVATGWQTNDFHQLSFGLLYEPGEGDHPGYLYLARSPGLGWKRNPPNHGSVWKIDLAGEPDSNVEPLTGGHRTPNGIGFGPDNEIFVIDNQGEWTPANELNHVRKGHFYGYYNPTNDPDAHPSPYQNEADRLNPGKGVTEAAIKLPQDEIANSPSQPILIPEGPLFAGQMLMGDIKYGGIQRLFLEKVNGVWQGAVFRFTQGLEVGINRLVWGPDGSLYAGGIGGDHDASWNWVDPQGNKTYQGLQRLTPNGTVAFEMESVRATPDGFDVTFTKPVARATLADPSTYAIRQWTYEASFTYGGPQKHEEILTVSQAAASDDGKTVRLTVPGLKKDRVVYLRTDPVSLDGDRMWSTETWYTLNEIPTRSNEGS
ncbi:MAG: PQQ-dependent sugar dehydrogenase [Bacteroidetes bacterium]|nr:PQQ-dependent sugar dehydrogenase [Bacteroidota bacterium]